VINGTPVTISSIYFYIINQKFDGKFVTYTGEAITDDTYGTTVAANSDYQTVIAGALNVAAYPFAASYEGAAAWKAYKFYPAGRTIVLARRKRLFPLLQQKYMVFATENGWDGVNNTIHFFVATDTRAIDYTISDPLFNNETKSIKKKVIWRDEANTVHTLGTEVDIHNLGYLESTASAPANLSGAAAFSPQAGRRSTKLPIHLKYLTGDKVEIDGITANNGTIMRVMVTEVLDTNSTPSWHMIMEPVIWFNSTEGGAIPSTLQAAAPYTPLVTGNFDGILTANDNNLQAAMETIDDHNHGVSAPVQAPTATNDFLIGTQVATVWTWVKNTLAQTITVLRTSLDSIYAAASHTHTHASTTGQTTDDHHAKSHVHTGDGSGTVSFLSLSNLPAVETNANDIYRCVNSPGGTSAWTGTINGAPSGASVTLTTSTGTKASLKPFATTQLGKMRLYNTTRGNNALISDFNTTTNVCTLTANAPANWANGDSLTIASQTVSGGGVAWTDIEITSGPTGKTNIGVKTQINSGVAGDTMYIHPLITYAASQVDSFTEAAANQTINGWTEIIITNNVFSFGWNGTPVACVVREGGYIK
jgi:hypothetical protein